MVLQLWEHSGTLLLQELLLGMFPQHKAGFGSEDEEEEAEAKQGWESRTKGPNEPVKGSPHLHFAALMLTSLRLKIHLPKSCWGMFYWRTSRAPGKQD